MLAFVEAAGYRLINRHGIDTTARYPEFDFLAGVAARNHPRRRDGRASARQARFRPGAEPRQDPLCPQDSHVEPSRPATYIAFDLLYENHVLLARPTVGWNGAIVLRDLVRQWSRPRLVFSQGILGQGRALFAEAACRQDLEGIMAKHVNSRSPARPQAARLAQDQASGREKLRQGQVACVDDLASRCEAHARHALANPSNFATFFAKRT